MPADAYLQTTQHLYVKRTSFIEFFFYTTFAVHLLIFNLDCLFFVSGHEKNLAFVIYYSWALFMRTHSLLCFVWRMQKCSKSFPNHCCREVEFFLHEHFCWWAHNSSSHKWYCHFWDQHNWYLTLLIKLKLIFVNIGTLNYWYWAQFTLTLLKLDISDLQNDWHL